MKTRASVVVTTHESPRALELVLAGLSVQTTGGFEVVVAEDGSDDDTAEAVGRARRDLSARAVRIVHVRQVHRGFRAARIRNLAALASSGEILAFLDGDCIPHPAWFADILAAIRKGRFLQGHRVLLSEDLAAAIEPEAVRTGRALSLARLARAALAGKVGNLHNALRLPIPPIPAKGTRGIRAANLAVRREDFFRANGFDESYEGWGREDADLALRLEALGVRRYDLRNRAIVYHLGHPPRPRDALARNDALLAEAARRAARGEPRAVRGALPS